MFILKKNACQAYIYYQSCFYVIKLKKILDKLLKDMRFVTIDHSKLLDQFCNQNLTLDRMDIILLLKNIIYIKIFCRPLNIFHFYFAISSITATIGRLLALIVVIIVVKYNFKPMH